MKSPTRSASTPALLAGLGAAAIWGGMYVVSKVVLAVIPPFALLSLRLALGFLCLWLVVALRGGFHLKARQFGLCLAVGFVGYAVSLGFQFVGTRLATASLGALVTSATPALVLPFAAAILGEKATARRLVALAAACLGVVAVIDPRSVDFSSARFLGSLLLLAAALSWALYSVLVRRVSRPADVLQSSAVMLLGGLPTSVAIGAWEVSRGGLGPIGPGTVAGVLFLGIVCTAVAMFLWNYAFAALPASTASLTFFAQPVVGTLLGWALLGERLTLLFLAGGLLIALGIFVSRKG